MHTRTNYFKHSFAKGVSSRSLNCLACALALVVLAGCSLKDDESQEKVANKDVTELSFGVPRGIYRAKIPLNEYELTLLVNDKPVAVVREGNSWVVSLFLPKDSEFLVEYFWSARGVLVASLKRDHGPVTSSLTINVDVPPDALLDNDNDGLPNIEELIDGYDPEDPDSPGLPTLSTSYVSPTDDLDAVMNQIIPASSADITGGAYGNWRGVEGYGETNYISFTWETTQTLAAFDVYWWDDNAVASVPTTAILEYLDGTTWVKLGDIGVELNQFNRLDFPAASTRTIRLSMSSELSTGILEARAFGTDGIPATSAENLINVSATDLLDTSFVSPHRRVSAINNKSVHKNSYDRVDGAYGNWRGVEGFGETNWVSFRWETPQELVAFEVYWWNRPDAEILVPDVALVEYWDGNDWSKIDNIGLALDQYNRLDFPAVSTTSIRISMSSSKATGILEARVFAIDNVDSPLPASLR